MKIIAIEGIDNANNTNHLPIRGDWYVTHQNPSEYFDGKTYVKNYDFLIRFYYGENKRVNTNKELNLIRLPKYDQQLEIFNEVKRLNLSNYRLRTCVKLDDKYKGAKFYDKMIMKLGYGARSLGLFIIETRPQNQLSTATQIKDVLDSRGDLLEELSKIEKNNNAKITPIFGKENYHGESIEVSKSQEYILEEFVTDVISEYRLLVTNRKIILAQRRDVKGLCIPLGSEETYDGLHFIENMEIRNDLYDLIKTGVFNWCSVDLFLTKDGFGFFEYQPQFGTNFVPVDSTERFYSEMLEYIKVRTT